MSDRTPFICIMVLIGIPASGKSYFRKCFTQFFLNGNNTDNDSVCKPMLKNTYIVPVCYDSFINEKYISDEDNTKWKSKRKEIFSGVENILNGLKANVFQNDCLLSGVFNMSNAVQSTSIIFIIDDNMYYQSMRYEYHKLARKYNTGFCQFFFKAKLQDALHYNSLRNENRVSESTIIKMYSKLEPPNANYNWEKLSLQVDSFTDFNESRLQESVINIIVQCLRNPVKSYIDTENKKDKAREITNSNLLHQIDLILRQIVGERIKEVSSAITDRDSLISMSQLYCNKRKVLLQKIKKREIALPLSDSVFQKNEVYDIEVCKTFLSQMF